MPILAKKKIFEHSKELIRAFTPIRFFLVIIGQMPYDIKKKKDNTYSFKLSYTSKSWFVFLFFFSINSATYILVTFGIITFMLTDQFHWINPTKTVLVKDSGTQTVEGMLWERYHTRREMVPVLVIWSWMTIANAGSVYVIMNGKFYVHYMNYFNRVVQVMDMDMTPGIQKYLWKHNLFTVGTALLLIVGFASSALNFSTVWNTSGVLANFILRVFGLELESLDEIHKIGGYCLGLFIMLFALVGSRANIVQFLFFSQLLKNGAKIWNERLTTALELSKDEIKEYEDREMDEGREPDQFHRRLDLKHVLKDHLILVQLFRMTETVFGNILLTYYCFVIVSVVMEIYQLAALGGFAGPSGTIDDTKEKEVFETDAAQEYEVLCSAVVCILLTWQNIYFAISTTTDAAGAYEQAMEGFHILRQHGFMYCRNKADRNFVMNLFVSFSKRAPLQLTAGGYFAINKALLVSMSATIVNWAVSIYQTKVDQWK